jgi:CRP-like cAMP-binding protein
MMEVIDSMAHRDVPAGEMIIEQDSKDGKEFYVLYAGECQLTKDTKLGDGQELNLALKPTTGAVRAPCFFLNIYQVKT